MGEEMASNGAGVGVLGVGIDIHFDDAVIQSGVDIGEVGPGASMKDEPMAGMRAEFFFDGRLAIAQDIGAEFDIARFVHAMHIAKGGRIHKFSEGGQCSGDLDHFIGGGVKFFGGGLGVVDPILFTSDDPGFNLQNKIIVGAFF